MCLATLAHIVHFTASLRADTFAPIHLVGSSSSSKKSTSFERFCVPSRPRTHRPPYCFTKEQTPPPPFKISQSRNRQSKICVPCRPRTHCPLNCFTECRRHFHQFNSSIEENTIDTFVCPVSNAHTRNPLCHTKGKNVTTLSATHRKHSVHRTDPGFHPTPSDKMPCVTLRLEPSCPLSCSRSRTAA